MKDALCTKITHFIYEVEVYNQIFLKAQHKKQITTKQDSYGYKSFKDRKKWVYVLPLNVNDRIISVHDRINNTHY